MQQHLTLDDIYFIQQNYDIATVEKIDDTFIRVSEKSDQHKWENKEEQIDKIKKYRILIEDLEYNVTIRLIGFNEETTNKKIMCIIEVLETGFINERFDYTQFNKLHNNKTIIKELYKFNDEEKLQIRLRLPKEVLDKHREFKPTKKWKDEEYSIIYGIGGTFTDHLQQRLLDTENYIGMSLQDRHDSRFLDHIHNTDMNKQKTGNLLIFGFGKWFNLINIKSKFKELILEFETLMINFITYLTGNKNNINNNHQRKKHKEQQRKQVLDSLCIILNYDVEMKLICKHWEELLGIKLINAHKCSRKMIDFFEEIEMINYFEYASFIETICHYLDYNVDNFMEYYRDKQEQEEKRLLEQMFYY